MKKLILAPNKGEKAYARAVEAFADMYFKVTGVTLPIVYEDDGVSDLYVIGSDAVNTWLVDRMLSGEIKNFGIRYGTDDYCIRSINEGGRNVVILAGGRGRSTVYAVYDFFERFADCHYFWDGDVIGHKDEINADGADILEIPRFNYRGLRYFAHRGLHRFQAEHWSFEDWKAEIDWMVKKRLNFFMLRIGMDDLWQRVFPDDVPYPDQDQENYNRIGYNDRTIFWSLQYRGELRKKLLEYAFEYDLMHPEDCGTMSHWYSPTPTEFFDKVKFMDQSDRKYLKPETQIFDIRDDGQMEIYMKLTEGYVNEYNPNASIFHTIGMAERFMLPDRDSNMRLKLFAYRRIAQSLREKYPNSKLMIASWDFIGWWKSEEVRALLGELDPERTMLLDYTSDIDDPDQSFLNWGTIGKFPWIFGLFHAYEPESSLKGQYDRNDERLRVAAADPMCQGMIFWPELSHSDPLILEYLTENSWQPLKMTVEQIAKRFCERRYGDRAEKMNEIWQKALPLIKSEDWGGISQRDPSDPEAKKYNRNMDVHRKMWFNYECFLAEKDQGKLTHFKYKLEQYREVVPVSIEVLDMIAKLPKAYFDDPFILRDAIDLARTAIGRYMQRLMMQAKLYEADGERERIVALRDTFMPLIRDMAELLGYNPDFSMHESLERLKKEAPVNKNFEYTLKKNSLNYYCRQYAYEPTKYLYIKECELAFSEIITGEKHEAEYKELLDEFYATPLSEMKAEPQGDLRSVISHAADTLRSAGELF
ncbi:MAG: hypothetical protein E7640_00380 [Ruminococcaceae bacterium]|nr:hypothetical protein [Oscillospiraceae bacterium]